MNTSYFGDKSCSRLISPSNSPSKDKCRVLGYIETFDLNHQGKIFFPDIVQEIAQRYSFQKFPQTFEYLDEQKGIEFHEGRAARITAAAFVCFA